MLAIVFAENRHWPSFFTLSLGLPAELPIERLPAEVLTSPPEAVRSFRTSYPFKRRCLFPLFGVEG